MISLPRSPFQVNMPVAVWLLACIFMVLSMMAIGAITRLTESGLSMVEWRPLIGWLPPLSEAEWQRVFDLYRETSQYSLMNKGMSLEAFQEIFFWEYVHRVWGRLIGIIYTVPFFVFLFMGRLPQGMRHHYVIALLLGGLQGVIGWWMVKSGFVDRIEVSQYRLAVHLGVAFLILGYLVYLFLCLSARPGGTKRNPVTLLSIILFTTILSGALVAGLNAGFLYNTWPLMDGSIIPDGYWEEGVGFANLFENMTAVQFNHRTMAYITILAVAGFYLWSKGRYMEDVRQATLLLLILLIAQMGLGILTLLYVVPITLATLHQLGAAACFMAATHLFWRIRLSASPIVR